MEPLGRIAALKKKTKIKLKKKKNQRRRHDVPTRYNYD